MSKARKKMTLQKVLNRFPEHALLIKELYKDSDSFRGLCEDYAECSEVINRLDYSEQMIQTGYREEYEALLRDLENELIYVLTNKIH